jgi:hypothetical protein
MHYFFIVNYVIWWFFFGFDQKFSRPTYIFLWYKWETKFHGFSWTLPPVNVLRKNLFFLIYYVAFIDVLIGIEKIEKYWKILKKYWEYWKNIEKYWKNIEKYSNILKKSWKILKKYWKNNERYWKILKNIEKILTSVNIDQY